MTEFEDKVKRALNIELDAALGPREPAPPFDPSQRVRAVAGAHRRWLMPAISAACIIGAVLLALGLAGVFTSTTPHRGAVSSQLHGAIPVPGGQLALPTGWVAVQQTSTSWCLTAPGSTLPKCVIKAASVASPTSSSTPVDVDRPELGGSNASAYCTPPLQPVSTHAETRTFGGRPAAYRDWLYHCPDGAAYEVQQYAVLTKPAYVLFTRNAASATVRTAMSDIARRSSLPAQAKPLLLMDRGIIRSITAQGANVSVSIEPVVRSWTDAHSSIAPSGDARRTYEIATSLFNAASLSVGSVAYIETDGENVLVLRRDAG